MSGSWLICHAYWISCSTFTHQWQKLNTFFKNIKIRFKKNLGGHSGHWKQQSEHMNLHYKWLFKAYSKTYLYNSHKCLVSNKSLSLFFFLIFVYCFNTYSYFVIDPWNVIMHFEKSTVNWSLEINILLVYYEVIGNISKNTCTDILRFHIPSAVHR